MLHGSSHWKATIYTQPQEVSKGPTTLGTYSSLPKNGKGRFCCLNPLGVNLVNGCGILPTRWEERIHAPTPARQTIHAQLLPLLCGAWR
jgi:hypothetical protein